MSFLYILNRKSIFTAFLEIIFGFISNCEVIIHNRLPNSHFLFNWYRSHPHKPGTARFRTIGVLVGAGSSAPSVPLRGRNRPRSVRTRSRAAHLRTPQTAPGGCFGKRERGATHERVFFVSQEGRSRTFWAVSLAALHRLGRPRTSRAAAIVSCPSVDCNAAASFQVFRDRIEIHGVGPHPLVPDISIYLTWKSCLKILLSFHPSTDRRRNFSFAIVSSSRIWEHCHKELIHLHFFSFTSEVGRLFLPISSRITNKSKVSLLIHCIFKIFTLIFNDPYSALHKIFLHEISTSQI